MRSVLILPLFALCAAGCGHRAEPVATRTKPASKVAREGESRPPATLPVPRPGSADTVWRVVSVHDGDTVRALDPDKREHRVRLHGIDAPEVGQAFGTKSRDGLRTLVMGKVVTVDHRGEDRYGRTLARLEVDGRDVNREMVAAGLAWHYVRYSDDASLAAAEVEARAAHRGLWADREPVPPWEWRAGEQARKTAAP